MNTNTLTPEDIPEPRRREIFENIYKSITDKKQQEGSEENTGQNEPTDEEIMEILSPGFIY